MTKLAKNDIAPDIQATTTDGARFQLSEPTSSALYTVVYFFPKVFTPGCTRQTKLFRDNAAELTLARASVVGISTDSRAAQCEFAASLELSFPLISDEDKAISRAYGVLWPLVGRAQRATFVLDRQRTVMAVIQHELFVEGHSDRVLRLVDGLYRARRRSDGIIDSRQAQSHSQSPEGSLLRWSGLSRLVSRLNPTARRSSAA